MDQELKLDAQCARARDESERLASSTPSRELADARNALLVLKASRNTPALMRELPTPCTRFLRTLRESRLEAQVLRWMVLHQAASLPSTIETSGLSNIPAVESRYASHLKTVIDGDFDYSGEAEIFIKDLRFSLALSIPAGAWWVDIRSRMAARLGTWFALRHPFSAIRRGAVNAPCLRLYVEPRRLEDFNERSLIDAFQVCHDLLQMDSSLAGLTVKAWFVDPQVKSVSPRLAYLHDFAAARGASFVRGKASSKDIERATMKSKTRRDLYNSGHYSPTPYSLFWERSSVLRNLEAR